MPKTKKFATVDVSTKKISETFARLSQAKKENRLVDLLIVPKQNEIENSLCARLSVFVENSFNQTISPPSSITLIATFESEEKWNTFLQNIYDLEYNEKTRITKLAEKMLKCNFYVLNHKMLLSKLITALEKKLPTSQFKEIIKFITPNKAKFQPINFIQVLSFTKTNIYTFKKPAESLQTQFQNESSLLPMDTLTDFHNNNILADLSNNSVISNDGLYEMRREEFPILDPLNVEFYESMFEFANSPFINGLTVSPEKGEMSLTEELQTGEVSYKRQKTNENCTPYSLVSTLLSQKSSSTKLTLFSHTETTHPSNLNSNELTNIISGNKPIDLYESDDEINFFFE
ncbi:MAG: hypothetical protein K2Q14_04105 [Gammaproteobacteria bacterium]|nr:hypothetical protein [Gammaproteobacteria bacterium]